MKNILVLMALGALSLSARADTIKFEDETCSYRAQFDSSRYSARQFHDTMDFMLRFNPLVAATGPKDGVSVIARRYDANLAKLNAYQLLPQPVFSHARTQMRAQLNFFKAIELTEARAYAAQSPDMLGEDLPERLAYQCRAEKMRVTQYDLLHRGPTFSAWHNCINSTQPKVDFTSEGPNGVDAAHKAFFGALKHVKKLSCDEP